jgi:hypothetical protein
LEILAPGESRVTRLGEFSLYGRLFTFGGSDEKKVHKFGPIFHKLIWSPCLALTQLNLRAQIIKFSKLSNYQQKTHKTKCFVVVGTGFRLRREDI